MPTNNGPFGDLTPDGEPDRNRQTTQQIIGQALGDDEQALVVPNVFRDPEPGKANDNDIGPGQWVPDPNTGLPDDIPVKPLGYDGDLFYYLTARGTVSSLTGNKSGEGPITALFAGRSKYLAWCWPPKGKRSADRWDVKKAMQSLFDAAEAKGAWNPLDKIRGRGAWTDEYGGLVWHAGDCVVAANEARTGMKRYPVGEVGFYLYPSRPRLPRPAARRISQSPGGGADNLLHTFNTWNWVQDRAPELMLGWVGQAFIGGALNWRSHVIVTGSSGVGKSTLQGVIRNVMGTALFASSDATAAGIYQNLQADSIAVAIDEAEAKEDDRRIQAVIELARAGSSGDKFHRGGADHKGVEYTVRNAFMLTGINPPSLEPQDQSRFAAFRLGKLTKKDPENMPELRANVLAGFGQDILRRMIDQWANYKEVLAIFHEAILDIDRQNARFADQYGNLVATQHVLLYDGLPQENEIKDWVSYLEKVYQDSRAATSDNWRDCLDHMVDSPVDMWRQYAYRTIRSLLYAWTDPRPESRIDTRAARKNLADVGCSLTFDKGQGEEPHGAWLFVPNKHPALSMLFKNTNWESKANAPGKWHNLFEQVPAEDLTRNANAKVSGAVRYGHKVKLSTILDIKPPKDAS